MLYFFFSPALCQRVPGFSLAELPSQNRVGLNHSVKGCYTAACARCLLTMPAVLAYSLHALPRNTPFTEWFSPTRLWLGTLSIQQASTCGVQCLVTKKYSVEHIPILSVRGKFGLCSTKETLVIDGLRL